MIYNTVSGETCIARVLDRFNIKTNDWIPRSNEWIAAGLRKLELYTSLVPKHENIEFNNYRFKLPCDLQILDGITYNGYRLNINSNIDSFNHSKIINQNSSYTSVAINNTIPADDGIQYVPQIETYISLPVHNLIEYTPNNHGWVDLSNIEMGTVCLYYRALPVVYSDIYKTWFPSIPDNEYVLEALDWYILTFILSRGYKHETYSLTSAQQILNPDIRFNEAKKVAKRSARSISSDVRRNITAHLTTFLQNPNTYRNYLINK